MSTDFYLVQRLHRTSATHPPQTGFDSLWTLEYMASHMFEFGAARHALERVRKRPMTLTPRQLTVGDITRIVYFIAHADEVDDLWARFRQWVTGTTGRRPFGTKTYNAFQDVFDGQPRTTNAWWALDSDAAWTLDEGLAVDLVDAFNHPAAAAA